MSCPYTSPQNGKAERILRTINNMLRSLLFQASIPARYWVEGLHTATYLLNRLPPRRSARPLHTSPSMESCSPISTCACSVVPAIQISPSKPLTNWHPDPPDVFFSDTPLTTKVISVLISPPTISSSPNTLFLMRQIFPSLPHPSN
jgi:hypothetical protein